MTQRVQSDEPDGHEKQRQVVRQVSVQIASSCLPDEVVRGIIDDWVVPVMLDQFLRKKKNLRLSEEQMHNGDQLP